MIFGGENVCSFKSDENYNVKMLIALKLLMRQLRWSFKFSVKYILFSFSRL